MTMFFSYISFGVFIGMSVCMCMRINFFLEHYFAMEKTSIHRHVIALKIDRIKSHMYTSIHFNLILFGTVVL